MIQAPDKTTKDIEIDRTQKSKSSKKQNIWDKISQMTHREFGEVVIAAEREVYIRNQHSMPNTDQEGLQYLKEKNWQGFDNVFFGMRSKYNGNRDCEVGNLSDFVVWDAIFYNEKAKKQLNRPMKDSILNSWITKKSDMYGSLKKICDHFDEKLYPELQKQIKLHEQNKTKAK